MYLCYNCIKKGGVMNNYLMVATIDILVIPGLYLIYKDMEKGETPKLLLKAARILKKYITEA